MYNMKKISILFFVILTSLSIYAKDVKIMSPDGDIEVNIKIGEVVSYTIQQKGQLLLDDSKISLKLANGEVLGQNPKLKSVKETSKAENIVSPFYKVKSFDVDYKEANLLFNNNFGILFRVYNSGVAYRFYTKGKGELEILDEQAEFNFPKDYDVYLSHTTSTKDQFSMAFQNIYSTTKLTEANDTLLAFLPTTVDFGNGKKLTILESDLESYPGMFVKTKKGTTNINGVFAKLPEETDFYPWRHQEYVKKRGNSIAKVKEDRAFPWRILAITESDAEMPVNHLVYALASPNRIGDYSWVKPGKSAWEWWNDWGLYDVPFKAGINMETYKYYIDFAAKYGLEYIILDEGWYNPKSGDMMTVIPELNLPELVNYAKNKNVGIVLWTVFNVLDTQLEEACKYYSDLGIKGFKIDFLDRDDQTAVDMTYRIIETAAKHKLFLDLHGFYKPTGLNRTYPNVINYEGVFGLEEAKWSTVEKEMPLYNVTFPFIRMMAGPVDYTQGAMRNATKKDFQAIYYNPMSQGTRCHQLATYVVFDSPFTMLCDSPTLYENEPEYTKFLASIPVDVDDTKILRGKMGEYIVTARKKGSDWYIGGLTNWDSRDLSLDFSFLDADKTYKAVLYKDGLNASKQGSDYVREEFTVNKDSKLDVKLASGGGFVLSLSN